jgi:hypothetical protein
MSMIGTLAIGLIFALVVFCAAKAPAKAQAPEFTGDVHVLPGINHAVVTAVLAHMEPETTAVAIVKMAGDPITNEVACEVTTNSIVICELDGLQPGTYYWVVIVATNAAGEAETPKTCFRTSDLYPTKQEIVGTVLIVQ